MLCINNTSTDIYYNLAIEEYLLKDHSEDILMLWQSDKAVVLGKHQDVKAEIDPDFAAREHIDIARRYSGGGTVYHDRGNLNLTFIKNTNQFDFKQYTRQVIDFLNSLGIPAQPDSRLGIEVGGLKISGSAQCIYKNRIMYHCTLLYSSDLETLKNSLNGEPGDNGNGSYSKRIYSVRSVKSEVANLSDYLSNPPSMKKFKEMVLAHFLSHTPDCKIYSLSDTDNHNVAQLRNNKYAANEWIWDRNFQHANLK